MKKNKFVKILIIIILVILGILLIHIVRNFIIFSNLNKKISSLENKDNIYVNIDAPTYVAEKFKYGNETKQIVSKKGADISFINFEKDNKLITIVKENGEIVSRDEYDNQDKVEQSFLVNYCEYYSIVEKIQSSIGTRIYTEKLDGIDCYVLTGYNTNFIYNGNSTGVKLYIEKETGLARMIVDKINEDGKELEDVLKYKYEFDKIKGDIGIE